MSTTNVLTPALISFLDANHFTAEEFSDVRYISDAVSNFPDYFGGEEISDESALDLAKQYLATKTIMQLTNGDDNWSPKAKAVHLAKFLGMADSYVHYLESQKNAYGTLIQARLKGLEELYFERGNGDMY